MIAPVLFIKLKGTSSNTSAYEDNSKDLPRVPLWKAHSFTEAIPCINPNQVFSGSSFFPCYRNRKSQKPPENQAFHGTSLEQPVQPRDAGTAAASWPGASLANPDYFVM